MIGGLPKGAPYWILGVFMPQKLALRKIEGVEKIWRQGDKWGNKTVLYYRCRLECGHVKLMGVRTHIVKKLNCEDCLNAKR